MAQFSWEHSESILEQWMVIVSDEFRFIQSDGFNNGLLGVSRVPEYIKNVFPISVFSILFLLNGTGIIQQCWDLPGLYGRLLHTWMATT